ncbi:thiamine pyrophosphate-dependent enzyme, partial [Angustibacter aerolatus]
AAGWLTAHRPDRVLVVGRPTLSRPVAQLLRDPAVDVELVAGPGPWPDPSGRARAVHPFAVLSADGPAQVDDAWPAAWRDAADVVAPLVRRAVETSWPSGTAVAAHLVDALPPGAQLLAGSSNAVRELDVAAGSAPVEVVANRGLAGIDGNVSTAAGLALASSRPTYALVGDLTLVHDLAGLVSGPLERRPDLTVVLVDDDGGGIFGLLEPGAPQHVQAFDRVFGTPLGLDLAAVCRALGARWTAATTPVELAAAVAEPPSGTHVVGVQVPRDTQRGLHEALRAAVADALGQRSRVRPGP